ncbi:phosphodiester glycosidase family protein [Leptolyngbya sp. AN02str]|uniref:phosphodiester glycosidase family protein n=1 Tax=Leptolyngbya sp. AN02str TaxID=3423363 RepID=UPI003D31C2E2
MSQFQRYKRLAVASSIVLAGHWFVLSNPVKAGRELAAMQQQTTMTQSWLPSLAQALDDIAPARQGTQIILNGVTVPAVWSLRQQRIGLADTSLMQAFGVEMLNSADPSRQTIQWFSDPQAEPFVVSTWLTQQYRFLDITDLARQLGWQVDFAGNALRIATQPAQVVGVRQGRQVWGDRIVVDLNQRASWRVTEQADQLVVTIDAAINPAIASGFVPIAGNRITGLRIAPQENRAVLQVGIPANAPFRVSTLPNPNRLVIDIRPDAMVERDIAWAPGMRWQQRYVTLGSSRFPVVAFHLNLRQPGLSLKPIWANPNGMPGTAPLVSMAAQWQAAGAINAGFFNRNNQLPLGAVRRDGQWLSGPILNRGAIAWNERGDTRFGRLNLPGSVVTSTNATLPIFSLNSGYVGAGLSVYTPAWGNVYTPILDAETVLVVEGDRITDRRTGGAVGQSTIPIPASGYLLVVRAEENFLAALPVGATVQLRLPTSPNDFDAFPQIMGAGPLLMQNGQIVLNAQSEGFSQAFIQQAAVRSAIGKRPNGEVMLVTVQNRIDSRGPTLQEMAQIMQQLGAVDALNLDGGSSTALLLGGQIINRSPRTAARVHNGIGVFLQPSP